MHRRGGYFFGQTFIKMEHNKLRLVVEFVQKWKFNPPFTVRQGRIKDSGWLWLGLGSFGWFDDWWWIVFTEWLTDERRLVLFPATFSDILTLTNLRLAASRIYICKDPDLRLWWMKLCSSDNHCTTA